MRKLYVFMALAITVFTYSQQTQVTGPGGVPGAVMWMQTVARSQNLNGSYQWEDISGDSLRLIYLNSQGEYHVSHQYFGHDYNFNPAILLTNPPESKEVRIKSSDLSTSTIIGVVAEHDKDGDLFTQPDYVLTLNSSKGKGFVVDKDKITNSTESGRGQFNYGQEEGYDLMYHPGKSPEPSLSAYKVRTLRSFTYIRTNKPVTSVWGEPRHSNLSLGEKFYANNPNNNSTYDTSKFNANSVFEAYIPEMIIYGRLLSPLERVKAETYLALKYGFMLERSYISSSDQLLWDIDQYQTYNHRVTGLYRDDKSGLYQRQGTTSYEEAPYYSYSTQGDSHDNADNYNLPNKNKLLEIERFPSNDMEDSQYMIWGDNDQNVQTQSSDQYLGMKLMNRHWLVKTNMGGEIPEPEEFQWISQDIDQTSQGYKTTFHKPSTDTGSGLIVSRDSLRGYEGHVSFTVGNLPGYSHVKFGGSTAGTDTGYDYGIFIDETGKVYPVIKSVIYWNNAWQVTVQAGDRVRINKTKDSFIISSNGNALPQTGQALPQINIAEEDQDKPFYVGIVLHKSSKDVWIKDVRTGGFINTGNRMELSYATQRAGEFADYKDAKTYLLVDRSGTGEFKKEDTDLYPSDEYDPYRTKIVFNNVFFDTDDSGKDVFTFGYRETNLIAHVDKKNPECDTSGNPKNDGQINVEILRGDEGFEYQLTKEETPPEEKSGVFFGKNLTLDSLSVGQYTLKLKEIGGFNILADSTATTETKAGSYQSIDWDRGGKFETTIKSVDQDFQMGITQTNPGGVANIVLRYGFEIKQGRIYLITHQEKSTTPVEGIYLKQGDKIQIYKDYNEQESPFKVYYKLNGVTFYTQPSISQYRFFMVKLNNNQTGVYHIKTTDGTTPSTPLSWAYQAVHPVPQSNNLSNSTIEHSLELESECQEPNQSPVTLIQSENNLVVYYKDFSNQSEITAAVKLKNPSPLTVAVFNFSGNLVYKKNITENLKEHTLDITGLPQGVYIVKIFTAEGEFTKKITLNY